MQTHFDLFHLPAAFDLDVDRLEAAYKEVQGQVHPDRFAHAGDAEQRQAAQWATRANEAYQTLKSPFNRACYLLELRGVHALDARNTAMPPAFLIQQMEAREALAEAAGSADLDALDRLERETKAQAAALMADIAALFQGQGDDAALVEALRKYRFLDKFLADIGGAYDTIG